MWRTAAAILVLAISLRGTRADTYPRQEGVDALHYTFRLTITDDSDEFTGEATAEIQFTKDGLNGFTLDLASAAGGKRMTVTEISGEGIKESKHENNAIHFTLAQPSTAGQKIQCTIKYHGVPAAGVHIGLNKYKERTIFSENWPDKAHQWLPCIDHPSDKATSEFLITAPGKYQVISNGALVEQVDQGNGTRMTHWKESKPIASWLNAIGIAQFSVHHAEPVRGIPLETWVYHQDKDSLTAVIEDPARKAIEFYSDFVGAFGYEKLANVEAMGIGGGTEHATAIFYGENSLNPRGSAALVAHEVAHHWFGDSVTEKDWDDVWLSEGFATYFALLYSEHYDGHDAFIAGVKRSRDGVLHSQQNQSLPVVHNNISDLRRLLNNTIQYQKGAMVLHMLRGLMGADKFQTGIRAYYKTYHDGSASTDDFRKVMEDAAGVKLDWFFKQWLYRTGAPVVEGSWHYDAAAKQVVIELAQTQPGEVFRLPVEVAVTLPGGKPTVEKIEMTEMKQSFKVACEKEPEGVSLDPEAWALMLAKFAKQ